mmetsp:Transcript_31988/g.77676  ORF Transcript_31988/g.77676 Transcript_31988/m.77676 type:complete len:374 (-) Transcript_31988:136-1257(-)
MEHKPPPQSPTVSTPSKRKANGGEKKNAHTRNSLIDLSVSDDDEKSTKKMRGTPELVDSSMSDDDNDSVNVIGVAKAPELVDSSMSDDDDNDSVKVIGVAKAPPFAKKNDDVEVLLVIQETVANQNKKPRKRQRQSFSCEICLEDDLEDWRGFDLTNCNHRFCLSCLANHIRMSTTTKITCPSCLVLAQKNNDSNNNNNNIDMMDIRSIMQMVGDQSSWQSFSERASLDLLEKEIAIGKSGTRRCPANRCNYTFVYEVSATQPSAEGTSFDCPQCTQSFCLQCGANNKKVGPSHKGMTCYDRLLQLQKQEEERQKFEAWKKENSQADARFQQLLQAEERRGLTKPCPRCKTHITKNGGCNHMKCTRCGLDYNW